MANAVRVRTASGWQDIALQGPPGPGGLLNAQRVNGQSEGYSSQFSPTSPNQLWADAGGTVPLRLTYTSPVDAWWDVGLNLGLLQKVDAAYHYAFPRLSLSPPDADGVYDSYQYVTQHASVQTFEGYGIRRMYKLAAGVAYTVNGLITVSGGTWQYHMGPAQLWIDARAYARGATPSGQSLALVTSLPATPTDGQEVYYLADAANGVIWHLRYRAAATGAFKWEFVGGPPLSHEIDTSADGTPHLLRGHEHGRAAGDAAAGG